MDIENVLQILEINKDDLKKMENISTEDYFHNNRFSIDAFYKKYALNKDESYYDVVDRVCEYISLAEKTKELQKYWKERWKAEILFDYWSPAGSIMQGASNNKKISMMNCTTIGLPDDSLEAIIRYTAYRITRMASYRQGLGIDYSLVRPRNSLVNNSANMSDGVISWMSLFDSLSYYVGQRGRIPAQLFSLSCKHPDLEEFITVKSNQTKIQNANISVQCTNDFYKAVLNNDDWELKFTIPEVKIGDKIYLNPDYDDMNLSECQDDDGNYYISTFYRKKEVIIKIVKAKKILEMIAKGMFEYGEPGIQNIDIAKKYSNSDYVGFPIISTNACSEQYLDDNGNCNLSSINCSKFYHKEKDFDLEKLELISNSIGRFLDNVVEMEIRDKRYATFKQKKSLEYLRRIGAGVTNIGGLLFRKNFEYGSEEGNDFMERFIEKYNYFLYKNSIAIGKEKGNFKAFIKENYCKSPFIKRMMKNYPDLEFDTMRNVCNTSIAPSGTLSLMFSEMILSYGIEEAFGLFFWKRTRISGEYKYYFCVPSDVRKLFAEQGIIIPIDSDSIEDTWDGKYGKPIADFILEQKEKLDLKFKDSLSVNPLNKLDLMSKIMKNIDSSISVTYLLPEDSSWKDVYNFILEAHKKEVKSIAAFPDRKMYGIVSFIPFKDLAFKMKSEKVEMHPQNFSKSELKELDLSDGVIISSSSAPKRPIELNADIYSVTVKGEKFIIAIGLLNNNPYEIFGGHMNGLNFKFQHKVGKIIKVSRGKYKLEFDDFEVEDFSQQFTPIEKSLFRSLSTSLRHGVPVKYIVEQLQKAEDDMFSIQSAASRVLKKYIKEKEKVTGAECPGCHLVGTLIYTNGCVECNSCQYQKCS